MHHYPSVGKRRQKNTIHHIGDNFLLWELLRTRIKTKKNIQVSDGHREKST